ncbi:thioredoxin-like domain-containing protein [Aequorivita sp. Q41]|uniref:TlpA family protein disulfide reductase n=1 Tax=Aequorivita sp. Q41 TaxID=3153300 RepID=UPI003242B1ED
MKTIVVFLLFVAFAQAQQTSFTEEALGEKFLSENNEEISLLEILKQYQGKTIFIDIWASWCKDCIVGMPKVQNLRKENPEIVFLFLSLDKETSSWKNGIKKYNVVGENYFIKEGWKGKFCSSIDLDWIPRYMVVNPKGEISLYKAIETNDENLIKALK